MKTDEEKLKEVLEEMSNSVEDIYSKLAKESLSAWYKHVLATKNG